MFFRVLLIKEHASLVGYRYLEDNNLETLPATIFANLTQLTRL